MTNASNNPAPQKEADLSDAQIVRGGGPSLGAAALVAADRAQRWFVRSADAIKERMRAFDGLDPARDVKNVTGWAAAAISVDQAAQDVAQGNYGDAAFHGFVAANIAATSVPKVNDAIAKTLTSMPVTGKVSSTIANVLASGVLNPEIKAVCGALKPVPLAGAAINGVMGVWAAGARALHGDYKGAGGELAVTVAGVGVYAGAVVVGAALVTAGAPLAVIGAAAVGAYVVSEAATEIAARTYNHFAGTDVRGSGLVAIGGYAYKRVSSLFQSEQQKSMADLDAKLNVIGAGLVGKGYGAMLDKDGDGKITATEIRKYIGTDGVRDLLVAAKNGLTGIEVVAEVKQQTTENYTKELRSLLAEAKSKGWAPKLDSNKDGIYDMADVQANLKKSGIRMDANLDGHISGGEFIRAQIAASPRKATATERS